MTFSLKINRNYGNHSIEFGLSEVAEIRSGAERRTHFNGLVKQLEDQIEQYEKHHLSHVTLPTNAPAGQGALPLMETLRPSSIVVEHKNGKRMISLKGGKYQRHGVPIYEDTCKTDLPIESYEYGEHDISQHNLMATIDIEGGSPKRVTSIK